MVYFDGDLVSKEHIETRLKASSALAVETGYNMVNGQPQVYYVEPPQEGVAPEDPLTGYPPPFVTYYSQSGGSQALDTADEEVVWLNGLWSVIVNGPEGDAGRVDRAVSAVFDALQATQGSTSTGYINDCRVQGTLELGTSPDEAGVPRLRRGFTFRIFAQPPLAS